MRATRVRSLTLAPSLVSARAREKIDRLLEDSGWAVQVVGRYHDTLHLNDGTWLFHRRAAQFEA